MEATEHSAETRRAAHQAQAQKFPPIDLEHRPIVKTDQAAHYLTRTPQTLRGWSHSGKFPEGLRPVRVNGRLGWPMDGIRRAVLGVA
jgi:hypothetical protein